MKKCWHCHSDIPQGLEIGSGDHIYCCHACETVAEIIHAGDLDRYYAVREKAAPRPNCKAKEHWQAYDVIAEQYVFLDGDTKEVHLYLDGIHCAACSWLIRSALQQKLELDDVRVNATTARAEIRWHSNLLLSEILYSLDILGYQPDLYRPDQIEKHFQNERNQSLLRLIVAGLGTMQVMMFATGDYFGIDGQSVKSYLQWVSVLCATPVLFYSGFPFLKSAYCSLKIKRLNMDVPITFALLGAYFASIFHLFVGGEVYFDSVTMFVFFISVSRFIEFLSRWRARLNQHHYAKLLPEVVELADKTFIPLAALQSEMTILVRPNVTFPADGVIINGKTRVDESMLTGESTPIFKDLGSHVLAGSNNLQSPVTVKILGTGQQTRLAEIQRVIARAEHQRAPSIDRNQRLAETTIFTVIILAAIGWFLWQFINPERAFEIALAVLVVTCPCALSLATPTVLTAALNQAQKKQILFRDSATLERLENIETIIFDKTGTLTQGKFQLVNFTGNAKSWQLAKSLEQFSNHPLAWFFTQQEAELLPVSDFEQLTGAGVSGVIDGERWFLGSVTLLEKITGIQTDSEAQVFLFNDKELQAQFQLDDPLRPEVKTTLAILTNYQLIIASGDRNDKVQALAKELNLRAFSEQSPEDKLNLLQQFDPRKTLMIGDGSNDAPILAAAGVSVAVSKASALSQIHADIVLLQNGVETLPYLFKLATQTRHIIKQNLLWAVIYNVLAVPLAIAGFLTPWLAALGMSLSSLIVILNALRIYRVE